MLVVLCCFIFLFTFEYCGVGCVANKEHDMKTALITGGSGTIGMAIAEALLSSNQFSNIFLSGRRLSKLQHVQRQLLEQQQQYKRERQSSSATSSRDIHSRVHVIASDISNEDSVMKLFQEIDEKLQSLDSDLDVVNDDHDDIDDINDDRCTRSRIDLLVNNAGITTAKKTVEELSAKDMKDVLDVNVVGAFLCSREAIKRMKRKQKKEKKSSSTLATRGEEEEIRNADNGSGGRIINIGSISSKSPRPQSIPYTTSKFALQGLSQSLSLDCRHSNIAVGIIHPGNVQSELLSPEDIQQRKETEGFICADDVAQVRK